MRVFNYKIIVFLLVISFYFACPVFVTGVLAQDTKDEYGLEATKDAAFGEEAKIPSGENVPEYIGTLIGAILAFVGVIFLVLMIYGGFTWMLARGKEQEITKAKETIISAVYGIVIVMGAYAVTWLIFNVLIGKG